MLGFCGQYRLEEKGDMRESRKGTRGEDRTGLPTGFRCCQGPVSGHLGTAADLCVCHVCCLGQSVVLPTQFRPFGAERDISPAGHLSARPAPALSARDPVGWCSGARIAGSAAGSGRPARPQPQPSSQVYGPNSSPVGRRSGRRCPPRLSGADIDYIVTPHENQPRA